MIIGNFTYNAGRDGYTGEIVTLTTSRKVTLSANESREGNAPDYRIFGSTAAGPVELGAAWKKQSDEGRDYLSVKLEDPALAQPIHGALMSSEASGKFILVWSRDSRKKAA